MWWPARTRFEVMVGAILTQNTAWLNVEKAIRRLKAARVLSPAAMHAIPTSQLSELIRSSGAYRVKAVRLKNFTDWLMREYDGNLNRMLNTPTDVLRRDLLQINGIGKETADSMLLYAGRKPVFVIDAYTRRILKRHGWVTGHESYDELASQFEQSLPTTSRVTMFNEYHALLVLLAKQHCRSAPLCTNCPLKGWLPPGGPL